MTNEDKPSVERLIDAFEYAALAKASGRDSGQLAIARKALRERLASEAAPAAQPATPLREVLSDADRKLMEQALQALERSRDWLATYPGGGTMSPTGPYEQARIAIAALRSRLDGTKT